MTLRSKMTDEERLAYFKQLEIEENNRKKKIEEIVKSDDYMLWLEKFTISNSVFNDNNWLYCQEKLSDEDRIGVENLQFFYQAVEKYANENSIMPNGDECSYESFYSLKFNGIGYDIGEVSVLGTKCFCRRTDIIGKDDKFIDFKDIQENKVINKKNAGMMVNKLSSLSDLINSLVLENVPLESISETVEKAIQKVKKKNND